MYKILASLRCTWTHVQSVSTSNAWPCPPRSSAPVPPRHPRTNKVRSPTLGPARHGPPHQSLPDIPGQTKSDLEHSALPATVLRTSPSPTSPDKQSPTSNAWPCRHGPPHQSLPTFPDKQSPTSNIRPCAPRSSAPVSPRQNRTNKVRPRMLGAARLARTRVPNISPLTRGN